MADSPALRAKRARKHKVGDHTQCRSESCDAAGTVERDVTDDVTSRVTAGKPLPPTSRGGRLWSEMNEGRGLSPVHRVLLEEACRVADRLDKLDAMLRDGRDWLNFELSDDGTEVRVTIDRLLAEARQQETAFKGMVAEIRQALEVDPVTPAAPVPAPAPTSGGGGGNVVPLRASVDAKRAQTTG